MTENGFQLPPGHAVITTHGSITMETAQSWANTQVACQHKGLNNIRFSMVPGSLVVKARNEAAANLLRDPHAHWLFFVDGDMEWHPDAFLLVLETAYGSLPWADIVGGWCPLRGRPYLPTVDPGSGTWEPISPGSGPIEVMRTGAAFVLIKKHVFQKLPPPWYGVRPVPRPIDALLEFDNYCLQKFDGTNPFRKMKEWAQIENCAIDDAARLRDPVYPYHTVGEDSGLADRARAAGFRIVVQTNAVITHWERRPITPQSHLDAFKEMRIAEAQAVGVSAPDGSFNPAFR